MGISEVARREARRRSPHAILLSLAILAVALAGCGKSQPQEQARRYHLVGKIVEVQQDQSTLIIDSQAIPGFMDAMTMPYPVRRSSDMAGLGAGDEITADVVVDNEGAYLEHIVVTKKGTGAAPKTGFQEPQPGEKVPDFTLIDQDGKRIHLQSFRGDVLLVTFIYTRCPFPDYCPLVSRNFARIYAATRKDPALGRKVRLLTVSFDPQHDTPAVLRRYGESFRNTAGAIPFDRWKFAVAPENELPDVAKFFGLTYNEENGKIIHSMSTTVISPDGTVYKWYEDNTWQPEELVADATQALGQDSPGESTSHAHAASKSSDSPGN